MTVNVLGRTYQVKFVAMGEDTFGDCCTDKKVIRINQDHGDQATTLVHEVLHAILAESGLKHLLDATEGLEEALVRAIEHGLTTAHLIPELDDDQDPYPPHWDRKADTD